MRLAQRPRNWIGWFLGGFGAALGVVSALSLPASANPDLLSKEISDHVQVELITLQASKCDLGASLEQLAATFFGIPYTDPGFEDEEREALNNLVYDAVVSGAYPIPIRDTGAANHLAQILNGSRATADLQDVLADYQESNILLVLKATRLGPHVAKLSLNISARKQGGGFCDAKTIDSLVELRSNRLNWIDKVPAHLADSGVFSTRTGAIVKALQVVHDGHERSGSETDRIVVRQHNVTSCHMTKGLIRSFMERWTGQVGAVLTDDLPIPVPVEGDQPTQHEPATVFVDLVFNPETPSHVTFDVRYQLQGGGLLASASQRVIIRPKEAERCADELRRASNQGLRADLERLQQRMETRFAEERAQFEQRLERTHRKLEAEIAVGNAMLASTHEARLAALQAVSTGFPGSEAAARAESLLERLSDTGPNDGGMVIADGVPTVIRTTDHGFRVEAETEYQLCDRIDFLVETNESCVLDIIYKVNGQYNRLSDGAMNNARTLFRGVTMRVPNPRALRPNTAGDVQLAVNCYPGISALNQLDGDILAAFNAYEAQTQSGFAETVATVTRETLGIYSDATVLLNFNVKNAPDLLTEFGECKG